MRVFTVAGGVAYTLVEIEDEMDIQLAFMILHLKLPVAFIVRVALVSPIMFAPFFIHW